MTHPHDQITTRQQGSMRPDSQKAVVIATNQQCCIRGVELVALSQFVPGAGGEELCDGELV